MNSLRVRLLIWLALPMTVFIVAAGLITRSNAWRTANLLQDEVLLSAARVMAGNVGWDGNDLSAAVSPSAIEILSTPREDQVFFRVQEIGGPMIAGTSDFPQVVPEVSPKWYDAVMNGEPVRAVSVIRPMYDAGVTRRVVISVGRTLRQRDALVHALWRPQMFYFSAILTIAVVLVCVGLTLELRPLARLARRMPERVLTSSVRVKVEPLRSELRPIVSAFNQCLEIIEKQTAMQRRFIADAAHQLRTPLTLLGTQLQYARRQHDPEQVQDTLKAMARSNRSLVALTNQLLTLAQAEAADYAQYAGVKVDLRAIATGTIEQLALLAQRRRVELAARLDAPDAFVNGNEQLLAVLVFNLVDNAIRYSPEGGIVTVSLEAAPEAVRLAVADEGAGIAAGLREKVFEPFFRASPLPGSGLGLAIVREIARAHRATLRLDDGPGGRGLLVTAAFPAG
ncbi:sensor histidine kinase [Burkholderia glumae]|uniref:sensor histidine kinase n=1 Tax=Burkholderia glumae TaxID=337 RepID=UPI00037158A8|nr:sensor histidine kinase [Burkholderia glumae]MCM2548780.1 sensor histidine kinase N-terminal domain-containing protein [Burkholderia glumae]NVE23577.1 sensor histidine kinase N-terminal domain-containing protein [Burkholderia glumae]PJO24235.1 sensor histidine kinase [Burkholderia glumae AU6208]QGA36697.1 sensor histidine kinase [Burkholderia glumae]QHE10992.1 sensor histidine kinase [Burkholderia glumae AU6208]